MPTFVASGYVCALHTGFSKTYIPGVGHYSPLPLDKPCRRCVRWEDLCLEWAEVWCNMPVSVRCMGKRRHRKAHLSDTPGGQRTAWVREKT